jgi:hypothetical protein
VEPKQYVVGHAREALARDGRTNALDLDVTVAGEKVFVTGRVETAQRREAVGRVLEEILPGYEIVNEVTVAKPLGASHDEAERIA